MVRSNLNIGILDVSTELLNETPDFFQKYLDDVTVLTWYQLDENTIRYLCLSSEFGEVPIPQYVFTFTSEYNGPLQRTVSRV